MSVDSDKKLTRYTSAVTVVTADIMNSLYGGEHGSRIDLDDYDPLVAGHVHDGEHADGHASKVLLDGGAHVRGHLSHANLGGSDGTAPAVQTVNIQCYSESIYGLHGGGNAIPAYTEDPDTGDRCYYLDLSMAAGGNDTEIQFNQNGGFGGSSTFTFDYNQSRVALGVPGAPEAKLTIGSSDNTKTQILRESDESIYGPDLYFDKSRLNDKPQDQDYLGSIAFRGWDGDNYEVAGVIQCRVDGTPGDNDMPSELRLMTRPSGVGDLDLAAHTRIIVKSDGKVGVGLEVPSCELDVDGDGSFSGDLNIGGKLTVAGLIDPTGLILTEESPYNVPTKSGDGAIFVSDGSGGSDEAGHALEQNKLYYKDASGNILDLRGARSLHQLTDVDQSVSDPDPGHVLKYDGQSNKWKSMLDEAGTPAGTEGSIQYNSNGAFAGDSTILIKNSNLGVGISFGSNPERRLHIIDDRTGEPPVRLESLTPGSGLPVVWNDNTGDLHYGPNQSHMEPKIITWPQAGADIIVDSSNNGCFVIIAGAWSGGKVIVPNQPPSQVDWEQGDYFWIKNMSTYSGQGGFDSHTYNSNSQGYIAIEVMSDSGSDMLDLEPFSTPYILPPKNAIQLCCVKQLSEGGSQNSTTGALAPNSSYATAGYSSGATGSNYWFLMSHYHELSHTLDAAPNAVIKVFAVAHGASETSVEVPNHGTVAAGYTEFAISGADSNDPDGDVISEYIWTLSIDGVVTNNIPTSTATFPLQPSKLEGNTVYLTLSVRANGKESAQASFDFTVDRANTAPVITLNGSSSITIPENTTYSDLGATASDAEDGNITGSIVTSGTVDTSTPGSYFIKYNVSDSNGEPAPEITRTIIVNSKPVITLLGSNPDLVTQGNGEYSVPGATASDAEDYDITADIQVSGDTVDLGIVADYTIRYNVVDSNGLAADEKVRIVKVSANQEPTITLQGDSSVVVEEGSSYVDAGATAYDSEDGDITGDIIVSGLPINTSVPGAYSVQYNVVDSFGQPADTVVRSVTVNSKPVISLIGDPSIVMAIGSSYVELGATVSDDRDNDLALSISGSVDTSTSGTYTINYNATDGDGLSADQVSRTVRVNSPPIISLNGPETQQVSFGESYVELGATATDDYDADVSVIISGSVDTFNSRAYTINYDAVDSNGLSAERKSRVVTVLKDSNQPPTTNLEIWQGKTGNITSSLIREATYLDYGSSRDINISSGTSNSIILNAINSGDSDGTVVEWNWIIKSVPPGSAYEGLAGSLNPSSSANPLLGYYPSSSKRSILYLSPDMQGNYVVQFAVKDDDGASSAVAQIVISV